MAEYSKTDPPRASPAIRAARFVEVLAAALLVGGLVATAAIAQVAFGSPEILSRETAGRLMAEVFERSISLEQVCALAILLGVGVQRRTDRLALVAVLLLTSTTAHVELAKSMREIRMRHGGTTANLAPEHEDRRRFGVLHGLYSGASLAGLAGGLVVLGAHALRKEA
jgi:hypothetical protein